MDQQTFSLMYSSKGHEWGTPLDLYHKLDNEFHFTTDPCTSKDNPLGCKVFYTKDDDGLSKEWVANCYVNPPYGKQSKQWIAKSAEHAAKGLGTVVMLIPCRPDTVWWHTYIWDGERHKFRDNVQVRFIKGRLRFLNPEQSKPNTAPFPSCVIVFHPTQER